MSPLPCIDCGRRFASEPACASCDATVARLRAAVRGAIPLLEQAQDDIASDCGGVSEKVDRAILALRGAS